jgi:hypothetical protein
MAELPLYLLTDAGFTTEEANSIVDALVQGTDLHSDDHPIKIENLSTEKKEALERFNMAVAADA